MTAHERIDAAIAARSQATPGPWEALLSKGMVYGHTSGSPVSVSGISWPAEPAEANTILIAAAPDLVDEVIRLRKWQQEALPWLEEGLVPLLERIYLWYGRGREEMYRKQLGELTRLIAEAQED